MDISYSAFIFLSVIMVAIGYTVGNAKNFNFWKFVLIALITLPMISQFNSGETYLFVMIGGFVVGFLLPHAYVLRGFSGSISDFINAIRYHDAYEDIKRKEEEVEELRRKYEQAQREKNQSKFNDEQAKRREDSKRYRDQQKQEQQTEDSSQNQQQDEPFSDKSNQSKQTSSNIQESIKQDYLNLLGLKPKKNYSHQEIKKAYRRMANKVHPDKHPHASESEKQRMAEKFKEINEAYKWLGVYY